MLPIRGSLYYVDKSFDAKRIEKELDAQKAAGFDLLWINGPLLHPDYPREAAAFDPIEVIMREAAYRKMTVYLEVMAREDWHEHWDLSVDLPASRAILEHLSAKYNRYASMAGYYLGNEIYVVEGREREYCLALWKEVAEWCRELTPGCRVVLSPFFVTDRREVLGYPYTEPSVYESFWNDIFREVTLDSLLLQDSGAEHGAFFDLDEREPYFAAVRRACVANGVELWGNVELAEIAVANYEELKAFRGELGANGPGFQDARWIQVPIAKLEAKMALASRYCSQLASWGYQQFVSPCSGKTGARPYERQFRKLNKMAAASQAGK